MLLPGTAPASGQNSPAPSLDFRADYGAAGDGSHDDGQALLHAFDDAARRHLPLHIPAGLYAIPAGLIWNMAPAARSGVTVFGDGPRLTVLRFTGDAGLSVVCAGGCDSFYGTFRDFGVEGRTHGALFRVGLDDCSDAHNGYRMENLVVQNANPSGAAALQLNGFYNGNLAATLNCGGASGSCAALLLQSAQFSVFAGSQGNAGIGTYLTGEGRGKCGYSMGNVFQAVDYEVLADGILIDSAKASRNTWVGGQMALYSKAFDFRAGAANRISNMNIGDGVSGSVRTAGRTGLMLDLPGTDLTGTPPFPASGTPLTNPSAQTETVNILGGTVTRVAVGGATVCQSSPCSLILNPSDSISVWYSVTPSWVWRSVD